MIYLVYKASLEIVQKSLLTRHKGTVAGFVSSLLSDTVRLLSTIAPGNAAQPADI